MTIVRIALSCAAAVMVAASAFSPSAPAQAEAPAPTARAITALRAITTMRASFVQTDDSGQRLTGTLTWKRPGKVRFEYQRGVPLLIVADGAALTMIDYDVRQVQRWPIRSSPLGALLDPDADVARFARVLPGAMAGLTTLELKDPRHPEFGTVTLTFVDRPGAPSGLELAGWVAVDAQNRRTSVRLSDQRYGMAIADSAFHWTDPRVQFHH